MRGIYQYMSYDMSHVYGRWLDGRTDPNWKVAAIQNIINNGTHGVNKFECIIYIYAWLDR